MQTKLPMVLIRCLLTACLLALPGFAQTAILRGQVSDESGAVIPGAQVVLSRSTGGPRTTTAASDGSYRFADVPPGDYFVQASAPSLALRQRLRLTLHAGEQVVNLTLNVSLEKQEVTVDENGRPAVSTDASANASAVVLRGADLDALSDNPNDLAVDLQALAGPAAGPNGGAIFIDGFSGGELPPKNSIREIRINQNPFSAEYDRLGYGRIEIFTKPGTDKFRGDVGYNFATDKWNSRNPYAEQKAPFHLHEFREALSGPLGKRASFNLNFVREWVDNGSVVNAVVLDPQSLTPTAYTAVPLSTLGRTGITPRIDYQLNTNNTLTIRYSYTRDAVENAGVGGFNLVERGYHSDVRTQTVQATETAVLGGSVVNETRFQFFRPNTATRANTPGAALDVFGSFSAGGAPLGLSTNHQKNYEFQNYTSMLRRAHAWRFGGRLRGTVETSNSPQNFGGTFAFGGGLAPELGAWNQPVTGSSGQPVLVNIDSIERYRRTLLFQQMGLNAAQMRLFGGGATQFSISAGEPLVSASQVDVGVFISDDWKARPNLTLSFGLRYETQTNIHDWQDFAPRIGIAWAPGAKSARSKPKSVIRAGFGMFYDRFSLGNTITAMRYNGVVQQQYIVTNPDFYPNVPPLGSLPGVAPPSAIQRISASLRAPYLMQTAIGFERELPLSTTIAVTYANTHGLHIFRSRNANAPLPGTYSPVIPTSGVFPLGRPGPVFVMDSSGLYNQNQVTVNVNSRINRDVSLNGSYQYNTARSDTDGLGTFPANPYSMDGEYGPAAADIRHRGSLTGTITPKWGIRFNPMLTANSGPPFNITLGHDVYGDTLFNARPGFATDPNKPGVVQTPYGLLDPNPTSDQRLLSRNFGRGPGQIMLNMRVGRTFRFGMVREGAASANTGGGVGGGGGADTRGTPTSPFGVAGAQGGGGTSAARRYSLTVSMQIRNLTNHNNPGPIIGNIGSPLFGRANQPAGAGGGIFSESANNRRLELQIRLTF
jgi:hypothetical protein